MLFDDYWKEQLGLVWENGSEVKPRGKTTLELIHQTLEIDMRRPVLRNPSRKLDYRFMAAEAFWILTGDDRVETIAQFNSRIAEFSDNGVTFFGAYGPKIMSQLKYVLEKLQEDSTSRQAVLTIWRECPEPTKDVPCTVAISFTIREGKLNCHVFMRSSDLCLGLPYDVFNFSMLGHLVCAELNLASDDEPIEPGTLYLTAVSSHLYEANWDQARLCAAEPTKTQIQTPDMMYLSPQYLYSRLAVLSNSKPGDVVRWWEMNYAAI